MRYLLIGYMWLFIHRPFEIWPILGEVRIELVYILVVLAAWAFYPNKRWLPNPLHAAFIAFAGAVVVCWQVSVWKSVPSDLVVENYFKQVLFYLLLSTVIHDEKDLKLFIRAFLVIMFLYMGHCLWEFLNGRHAYRMGIVRMIGVDTTMGDPNTFAASVLYALPLLAAFIKNTEAELPRWRKLFEAAFPFAYAALAVTCILFTGSRSGLLGLLVLLVILASKSRHRWRFAGLLFVAIPCVWLVLPEPLRLRFETIIWPEVGPENALVSANARLLGLETGLALWGENPLFGVGPGNWKAATGTQSESHNLYGELLGEMGTLGGAAFAAILLAYWSNLRRVKALWRELGEAPDFAYAVSRAVGIGVLLMLVEGNFGHNLFRFNWLWYGTFLIVARAVMERRLADGFLQTAPDIEEPEAWHESTSLARPL